ncbi:MAG: DUF2752 domain-containing protein [Candidatus Krumholzibacteriota bacterium]|nr:DUF2752 domain-containing protein [Candidatus Krumholzibacteriota bacterium]
MKLLRAGYRRNSNDNLILVLMLSLGALLVAGRLFESTIPHVQLCPFKQLLGLSCPGCGLMRAGLRLLYFDLAGSIRFNPLILLVAPYCVCRLTGIVVGLVTGRILIQGWPDFFVRYYQKAFIALWMLVAAVRLLTWVAPGFSSELHLPFCQVCSFQYMLSP